MTLEYKSRETLVGIDGNAFSIIGTVSRGLRRAGAPSEYVKAFQAEASSGDYDHVLQTAIRYTADEMEEEEATA
jgi:hypothetical protein